MCIFHMWTGSGAKIAFEFIFGRFHVPKFLVLLTHYPNVSTNKRVFYWWESSSLLCRVSGHDWKYITQRRQSTLATMLTINLRVRRPCRKCGGGGGKKKVVLADEKGAWRKRTLHLKWASVNTEIEKMEQQERGERRYEWEQFVSAELCSLRGWRIPFISMTGLKQRGETGETPQAK